MAIRRGVDNAVSDADTGGSGRRAQYWRLEEGKTEILRFLTDAPEWYVIRLHNFFPTKPAPKDAKNADKWPKGMTAVCRKDPSFADDYSACPLCDAIKDHDLKGFGGKGSMKTRSTVFALAVRREKIECDGSEAMGGAANKGKKAIVDRTVELDELGSDGKPSGTKVTVPDIRIVSNTMYSLFGGIKSAYETFDSVVDRDFSIKREKSPNGVGTVHVSVGLDQIPSLKPGTDRWKNYEAALEVYGLDLDQMLEDQAGDEFYNKFFLGEDGRAVISGAAGASSTPSGTSGGTVEVDEDFEAQLAKVKDRLSGNSSQGSSAPIVDFA